MVILLLGCSSNKVLKVNLDDPKVQDYISGHFMGELGTLPVGCKINSVEVDGDSVSVCGIAFDKLTEETFPINIWIGFFVEETSWNGYKSLVPSNRKSLMKTKKDGIFCVKFEIQDNDVLFMDEIGYDPATFKIFKYLKDANAL